MAELELILSGEFFIGGEQDFIQLTRDTLRHRINQGSGQDLFDLFPGLIIPRGLAFPATATSNGLDQPA
jgi:hypothetical protein